MELKHLTLAANAADTDPALFVGLPFDLPKTAPVPRKSRKTVQTVIKALLPEIEERLKTHSAEEVIPAVVLALGK